MRKLLIFALFFGVSLSDYAVPLSDDEIIVIYTDRSGIVMYDIVSSTEAYCIGPGPRGKASLKIPPRVDLYGWNYKTMEYDIYMGTYTVTGLGPRAGVGKYNTLQSISLPSTIKYINEHAFLGCDKLIEINIPNNVIEIGEFAFNGCTSLRRVYFSDNSKLEVIGEGAFRGCTSLSSITMPRTLKSIKSRAFENDNSLTSLVFHKDLETIEDKAFYGCTNIDNIHSYVSYPFAINSNVFDNSVYKNAKLYLESAGVAERYENQQYWNLFERMVYPQHTAQRYFYKMKSVGKGSIIVDYYKTEMDLGMGASWVMVFDGCTVHNEEYETEIPHMPGTGVPFRFVPDEGYKIEQVLYASEENGVLVDVTADLVYENDKGYTYKTTDKGSHPTLIATFVKDIPEDDNIIVQGNTIFVKQSGETVAVTDGVDATGGYKIPETVEHNGKTYIVNTIAKEAFRDNEELTKVTIPESIESIGKSAFENCINLGTINCRVKDPIELGATNKTRSDSDDEGNVALSVFSGVDKKTCILYVPSGSIEKYQQAEGWKEFENILDVLKGDANNDGEVNVADIVAIVNHINGKTPANFNLKQADADNNNEVNMADVEAVARIIMK